MASVMKELMDIFDDEIKGSGDNYERAYVFNAAQSLTNNCHQKSPREIEDFLFSAFTDNKSRENATQDEKRAWNDAIMLVELYFA